MVELRIQEARTETLRVAKDATLAAVQAARAQEAREDSIDSVQAVIDEGAKLKRGADGKIDPKEKAAWLRRGVAVWRARLASLPDPNPPALRVEVDAIEAATEANDMEAVSTHSRRLFEAWKDYGVSRATFLIHKATAPFCMRLRDDMLIDLEAIQQELGRLEASADLQRWDAERDRLRRRVDATPDLAERMTPDCLNVLVDLSGSAYRLRNEIVSAMWSATPLPETTKREIATEFGSVLTPEALANMRRDTRALSVTIVTPEAERYVEREIEFNIGNLGPNWGPSVMLTIDFGDGQQTSVNAEELPKKPLIHRYKSDKPAKVVVTAAELPSSGPPESTRKALGVGSQEFSFSYSPVSFSRKLADYLFNARFGLALLLASLLYFWRYQSKKSVFGGESFDYAEAFALGFAVSVAVNHLAEKLAEFAPIKG